LKRVCWLLVARSRLVNLVLGPKGKAQGGEGEAEGDVGEAGEGSGENGEGRLREAAAMLSWPSPRSLAAGSDAGAAWEGLSLRAEVNLQHTPAISEPSTSVAEACVPSGGKRVRLRGLWR